MRITTLIENSASDTDPRLAAEWGLSLHIDCNGRRILLDTGATDAFARNAAHLGVDLAAVDAAVLSHHHYDHGGGLRRFLELNSAARVHLGKHPEGECWSRRLGGIKKRCIGLPKALFEEYGHRFSTVHAATEILPDVYLFPDLGGVHPRPAGNRTLFLKTAAGFRPDAFRHEIALAIVESGRLVIFTGCSHNGVLNILDTVTRKFAGLPLKAVIGGFHMVAAAPFNAMADHKHDVAAVGRALLDYPADVIWTGHCTGAKALTILKGMLGGRLRAMQTGTTIDV